VKLSFITPGLLPSLDRLMKPTTGRGMLGGLHKMEMPTTVGVVELSNGSVVLVDCGLSAAEIARPASLGLLRGPLFHVSGGKRCSAVDQLRARAIDPSRVVAIVATHLHLDHIGAFVDFPNAEVIAPAAEFASARKLGSRGGYVHVDQILQSGRARPILLDSGERHGFTGYKELFDGEVLLMDTRGHTAGSISALVVTPEASGLMIGDAAYSRQEYRTGTFSPLMGWLGFQKDWIRATWGQIVAFERDNPTIPVVPSHCCDAFAAVGGH
jgi:glyoxylase-like metal-dependent hydrolase (beta-lactamase superfamily II)